MTSHHHRRRSFIDARAPRVMMILLSLIACACSDAPDSHVGPTPSQPSPGPDTCESRRQAFEATLPVPVPTPGRYVVQLVNESTVTLLAATDAAHRAGDTPFPVLPREGTWILPPSGTLTIDIPEQWERTTADGSLGPVFWARTGCRYDIAHDLAQCETGDCGGVYDCSKKGLTPPGPKSLAEWTFTDENGNAAPDISVVDGVNLTMDIEPLGNFSPTPVGPVDPGFWLGPANLPMSQCGQDLRATCPAEFQLRRQDLTTFIAGSPGGSDVVGCFSNCGQYKYQGQLTGACPDGFRCPGEPPIDCEYDPVKDPVCYAWKTFCCVAPQGDPDHIYGRACSNDADCPQNGSCWDNGNPQPTCACRGFIKEAECPPDVCTNQYSEKPSYQPPFGQCSTVTDATGDAAGCIGDDTVHQVSPHGLTWPNDPETYYSDAKIFRIVFAPGGTTVSVTDSGPPPLCSALPDAYAYAQAKVDCASAISAGALFAGARPPSTAPGLWDCTVADGVATTGVLCQWGDAGDTAARAPSRREVAG
jgi:hypothetical protein